MRLFIKRQRPQHAENTWLAFNEAQYNERPKTNDAQDTVLCFMLVRQGV